MYWRWCCDWDWHWNMLMQKLIVKIYIIKELILKQCSKFYASGGNIAKLRGLQGCQKHGARERELKIKIRGGGAGGQGGDTCNARVGPTSIQ
jgi:hypothetical protein